MNDVNGSQSVEVVRRLDETLPSRNGLKEALPARKAVAPASPMRTIHNALRGRYALVITAGLITAALCAAATFKLVSPIYTSEGLVRIAYSMPVVREQTDQNEPLAMFDTFMASQKTLITNRRVIDAAIQDSVWKAMNRRVPETPDQYFATYLKVDIKPRSELIKISVDDPDPVVAAAAVISIVNSYQELYNQTEKQLESQRIGLLDDQHAAIERHIAELQDQIDKKAQEFGTTKLDIFFDSAVARVTKLEVALNDVELALAGGQSSQQQPKTVGEEVPAASLTPELIAMTDGGMRIYLQAQEQRQDELNQLLRIYPDTNPLVQSAQENLEKAKLRVVNYAEMYRQLRTATSDGAHSTGGTANLSPEALKTNAASLKTLLDSARVDMQALGKKQLEIQKLQSELITNQVDLGQLTRRIEVLRGEGKLGGRLNVISAGEIPLSPSIDHRARFAGVAGGIGLLLPAGLAFLASVMGRRYRFADETTKDASLSHVPLLGMLPEVGRKFDAEVMHATAHGIHQMRVLLSANTPKDTKKSYLITSATEGEGKTNLTVALGMSFAAAKRRTLVIDCDFVGRRLTQGFKADGTEGLFEAMQEGRLGNRVRQESPMLFVLPTGKVASTDACGITSEAIRTMLAQAQESFDTVLIDTGPILGSLEAAVLAQEVDGVILTISRGQHPTLVEHALRRLSSVRAHVVGAVFNRAKLGDFHGSAYTSSQASSPAADSYSVERAKVPTIFNEFGPLVRAVSMGAPAAA